MPTTWPAWIMGGWRDGWPYLSRTAHVCIHTWTHTPHVEQQKEQQRNLGFISSSAIESRTFVSSAVKGMVGPATF